ncbi:MAG: phosphoenolpyruvate--protein phosphotransferase [Pseudomonadota bacterium]
MSIDEPMSGARRDDGGIAGLLRRMHDIVASEATPQERLDQLTKVIAGHVVADVCSIYLRLPDDSIELFSTVGLNREAVHTTTMKWGEGLVGQVCATRKPIMTADAPMHPAFAYRPETGEDPLHSFLGVPLLRSGKALGVLVLQNKKSRRYGPDEVEAAQAVATLLAEIAASGELLDERATEGVGAILHLPDQRVGEGVVAGVAIGVVAFHEAPAAKHKVFSRDPAAEAQRLEEAIGALRASVDDMLASPVLGAAPREVLETYRLFAYDRGWRDRLRAAIMSGLTAESAVEQVQAENSARMKQSRDPYMRERLHDLDDLAFRLLRHLSGEASDFNSLPNDAVVFARSMGPADLLEYDRTKLKGLVLGEASSTSHVAIVARALGVPLVASVGDLAGLGENGDAVVLDGETGEVFVRPTSDVVTSYQEKRELQSERQAAYARERELPAVTKDRVGVEICINAGLALDMDYLDLTGASGVGLFRTELQFLIGDQLPRVSAQQKLYTEVLELARGRPVVFRTTDIGGDKSADYMEREVEANPAMGWRGLRMAIDRPGWIRPQLRALLGAAARKELHILFPMVTLSDELLAAKALLEKEIELRRRREQALPTAIKIGAMIETPAAAWRLEEIAAHVDFLSVGGNDLAQFYFAADRNSAQTSARYDPLEPGFLSFVRMAVEKAAVVNKPISYCGEQAADLVFAAALMAVGLRKFSIAPSAVGGFRRLVRSSSAAELAEWAETWAPRYGTSEASAPKATVSPAAASAYGAARRDLSLLLRKSGVAIS